MRILITGAKGFLGRNLCAALKCIQNGTDKNHPGLRVEEILEYDLDTEPALLQDYCGCCDFVFHLAGVNRPEDPRDFVRGNVDFTDMLLSTLKNQGNACPVLAASSVQAGCLGAYDNAYGRSKRAGEALLLAHGRETGARVLIYRFPNVFGKWCRPHYNSVVATFCHCIARDLPITVHDETMLLELVYIDDLVQELLLALEGQPRFADEGAPYCAVPVSHRVTLGQIVALLRAFRAGEGSLFLPQLPEGSFESKLCSTYLSYLPPQRVAFPLKMNRDAGGSFTELLKMPGCGQVSVNIAGPGVTKGCHWHQSKWELFMVVSGRGLIRQRKIGTGEVLRTEVSGEHIQAVRLLPGYTHDLVNLSDTEKLITVMWASAHFDPAQPDTFFEEVE